MVNLALYQASWFGCVVGASYGKPWIGVVLTGVALVAALALAESSRTVAVLAVCGLAVGGIVESTLLASGLIAYVSPEAQPPVPPSWMLALWLGFAINLNELFGWLSGRPVLQATLGLFAAPLTYVAGEKLGAMTFHEPRLMGLAMIGILWSVAFPILMALAKWIGQADRKAPPVELA